VVTGRSIAQELRAGHSVERTGLLVNGPLDLTGLAEVRGTFKCHQCAFLGRVAAPNVTFDRTLDLSGSAFGYDVDFRGSSFHGPVLLRAVEKNESDFRSAAAGSATRASHFFGKTDFSLAVFEDFASFSGSVFKGPVAFRDTRFSDVAFNKTTFGSAAFDRASFRGAALFNGATFQEWAAFGQTDFRRRTDFSIAEFHGADFTGAEFASGASFLAATFYGSPDDTARFETVASGGDINFRFAIFPPPEAGESVTPVFSDFVCAGSLVLRDLDITADFGLVMDNLQVRDLSMDVGLVAHVDDVGDQKTVLGLIEKSAKARDDLGEANDAHYELQVLRSRSYNLVEQSLDYVFYRGLAGYLVRPFRPLAALVVLAVLLSLARVAVRRAAPDEVPVRVRSRSRNVLTWTGRRCGDFLGCFLDTLALAGPRRGGDPNVKPPVGARIEIFSYRLLLVCVLLGLANSNPTLRQMVDTLL
jgi:uncharacterized protein YjbI with pentapeptide repeats